MNHEVNMKTSSSSVCYDMIIIGAGIAGCIMAKEYAESGMNCLLLEAGKHFSKSTYPRKEIDANSQLYWSGGIELNTNADIGILRPKAVGGGSIVNQALLDRFDNVALDSFKDVSNVKYFNQNDMEKYYELALAEIALQEIPEAHRNKNAHIFIDGFKKYGYQCAPLKRAQKNCHYEEGNDCIECLAGCRIDSKQSMSITVLPKALEAGLTLESEFEVLSIKNDKTTVRVTGRDRYGDIKTFKAGNLTMASGAIGNSKLLLNSGFSKINKNIGKRFYTHPQFMTLAIYDEIINAQKGAFQSMKSDDPDFRVNKFKLENVFAPPVAISMLLPGLESQHLKKMKEITHMACIEVAVRDQNPGT
ncbi:MAG: GMC family oxidoreductase, partial [Bacteriovoracaceae bacterium]|nr:GMC family oxidoreductase [Bacteriovoracaceae bacterium]